MHPNCRCVIQPVMDGETKEEIVRRGRDEAGKGKVMPAGMSYKEWKEEYGKGQAAIQRGPVKTDATGAVLPQIDVVNRMNMVMKPDLSWNEKIEAMKAEEEALALKRSMMASPMDAETHDDLTWFMKAHHDIDLVDSQRGDFKIMKDSMYEIDSMLTEEPNLKENFHRIEVTDKYYDKHSGVWIDIDDDTQAHVQIDYGVYTNPYKKIPEEFPGSIMRLNANIYGDPKKFNEQCIEVNKFGIDTETGVRTSIHISGTTPRSVVVHEMGHVRHNQYVIEQTNSFKGMTLYSARVSRKGILEKVVNEALAEAGQPSFEDSKGYIAQELSAYARVNPLETIAEGERDIFIWKEYSSELSKILIRLLRGR